MAIPVPHTFTAGDNATSTVMQTLTDSILYWSGSVTSTGARKPTCRVRQTSTQALTTATWTAVTFDAEDFDYGNNHVTTVGSNDRFTATDPGVHWVASGVGFASNATGRRGIRYTVNGTFVDGTAALVAAAASVMAVPGRVVPIYLNTGDILRVEAFQDSGGSLNTAVSGTDVEALLAVVLVSN